ncbi:MAG: methyltransferase domain-containing protein [Chloroflexi bacterium]|nr:methyltransferase domain-containing protein [Chloroflexota bacterium]
MPVEDNSLDVVVSFETIEHHDKHDEMLSEIKRILRPDGLLIISSPNRVIYSEAADFHNPYHVKELDFEELDTLLKKYFSNISYYGQNPMGGSFIYDYRQNFKDFRVVSQSHSDLGVQVEVTKEPTFFIALCSDVKVETTDPSVYLEPDNDMFAHIKREATRMQASFDENYEAYKKKMEETQEYITAIVAQKDKEYLLAQESFNEHIGNVTKHRDELSKRVLELTDYTQLLTDQQTDLLGQIKYLTEQVAQLTNQLETEHQNLATLQNNPTVRLTNQVGKTIGTLKNRLMK